MSKVDFMSIATVLQQHKASMPLCLAIGRECLVRNNLLSLALFMQTCGYEGFQDE